MTQPDHPGAAESELEARTSQQDVVTGLMLALFAASLALCDLGGARFGHEQLLAANEKAQAYASFQAKGVKQSLAEGEADLLKGLLVAGTIDKAKVAAVSGYVQQLDEKAARYFEAFAGVSHQPARVKCAVLPWNTLHAALHGQQSASTEGENDPVPGSGLTER